MADVREKITAELENIERVLEQLPGPDSIAKLSSLELAGVAALLHNFYNGVENILKQLLRLKDMEIADGPSWHRDVLTTCTTNKLIREVTAEGLKEYLAFRHFFSHGYSFDIDKDRIAPLAEHIEDTYRDFVADVEKLLQNA